MTTLQKLSRCALSVILTGWIIFAALTLARLVDIAIEERPFRGKIEGIEQFFKTGESITLLHRSGETLKITRFDPITHFVAIEDLSQGEKPWVKYHGIIREFSGKIYKRVEIHVHKYRDEN